MNYVHKRAGNVLGWVDTGATWAPQTVQVTGSTIYGEQVNQTLTVQRRTSSRGVVAVPAHQRSGLLHRVRRAHPDRHEAAGRPVAVHRWLHAPAGARTRAGGTAGRDISDLINLEGYLGAGIGRTWSR